MTTKTTLHLLAGVFLLGTALFLVDHLTRLKKVSKAESHRVFDLANTPVTGITITRDALTIECLKKGYDWFLSAPVRARGDAAAIERIAAVLECLDWSERITVAQREARDLTLADYGLTPPRAIVSVDTADRRETLLLGDPIPLGNGIYARHSRSDAVLTVPVTLIEILPKSISPLRDRAVLHGTPATTVRFEIQRRESGFIQLVRQSAGWSVQQPLSARADAPAVQRLLESLYALRVESFLWDVQMLPPEPAGGASVLEMALSARVESCGLAADAAQARVTVWVEGDSLGQELLLGKPDPDHEGSIFAKRGENEAIYRVSGDILKTCNCELSTLRNRTVFPVAAADVGGIVLQAGETKLVLSRAAEEGAPWTIVEPVQWAADLPCIRELAERIAGLTVRGFLDESVDDLAAFGLAPPAYAIALRATAPADMPPTGATAVAGALAGGGELLIGAVSQDGKTRFAKMAERDELFSIAVSQLAWLTPEGVDPLLFRDRTMLSLSPNSIRRITVATSAGQQGVERGADESWACIGTGQQMVSAVETIRKVLQAAANVRAVQIEARDLKSLDAYGLAAPKATVTFGLQGEQGIQKSLLIGASDGQGRVYAMVLGQDVIFRIPDALAALFAQPLCVMPPPPAGVTMPAPPAVDEGR